MRSPPFTVLYAGKKFFLYSLQKKLSEGLNRRFSRITQIPPISISVKSFHPRQSAVQSLFLSYMQTENSFLYILQKKIIRGSEPQIQADYTDSADFNFREICVIRVNLRFRAFTLLYAGRKLFLIHPAKKIIRGLEPQIQADYTDSADFNFREICVIRVNLRFRAFSCLICRQKTLSYTSCKKKLSEGLNRRFRRITQIPLISISVKSFHPHQSAVQSLYCLICR